MNFSFLKKDESEQNSHEKFVKKTYTNKNRSKKFVRMVLFLFFSSMSVFLSSAFWLPSDAKADQFVPYQEYTMGSHAFTIVRFDYSAEQEVAEVEVDINDNNFESGNYEYIAQQSGEAKEITTITKDNTNIIFQIRNVEKNDVIKLTIGFVRSQKDLDRIVLSYNPANITQVKDLTPKTKTQYRIQRLYMDIERYQKECEELNATIKKEEDVISSLSQKNIELEENKQYKSDIEKEDIEDQITSNSQTIKQSRTNISLTTEKINELNAAIQQLTQKINELQ